MSFADDVGSGNSDGPRYASPTPYVISSRPVWRRGLLANTDTYPIRIKMAVNEQSCCFRCVRLVREIIADFIPPASFMSILEAIT
jgi:hypothetical protein